MKNIVHILKFITLLFGLLMMNSLLGQENSPMLCNDGIDNDGDGNIDCEDGDCISFCVENLLGECVTIDFESINGETPQDVTPIQNQFLGLGVSFVLSNGDSPVLVGYDAPTQAFQGVGGDGPQPGYELELGDFFITDDGDSGGLDAFTIILDFQLPVNIVSGQILDIDNSEVFTAEAFDENGNFIASAVIDNNSPNTGNGIPTTWELESGSSCIWQVTLTGESDGFTSFGYGLDNFNFCYGDIDQLCDCLNPNNPSDWLENICFGCTDPFACNYNDIAINDDESCIYPDGCLDPNACNYDADAQCDDGSCLYGDGCTDPEACNFDMDAACNDNSCVFPDGCTDPLACNYSVLNLCDDGSCIFPDGCTDPIACNFLPSANCDDGTCDYSCLGCTDPLACNYDPDVTVDNGLCTYPGCTNWTACNFDWEAGCDDGSCILPDGCNSPVACNYDPEATCDDGSCDFISCLDCAGVPFGNSIIDTCHVCFLPEDPLFNQTCIGGVYVPNSFTPNGDGINDLFYVKTERFLTDYSMEIYNHWGEVIFKSQDLLEPWDGGVRSGNYYVQNDLYLYILIYSYDSIEFIRKKGYVSIVR